MILRSRITQHPERPVPEHAPEILTQGMVAHAGFVEDGRAVVIPSPTTTMPMSRVFCTCTAG